MSDVFKIGDLHQNSSEKWHACQDQSSPTRTCLCSTLNENKRIFFFFFFFFFFEMRAKVSNLQAASEVETIEAPLPRCMEDERHYIRRKRGLPRRLGNLWRYVVTLTRKSFSRYAISESLDGETCQLSIGSLEDGLQARVRESLLNKSEWHQQRKIQGRCHSGAEVKRHEWYFILDNR